MGNTRQLFEQLKMAPDFVTWMAVLLATAGLLPNAPKSYAFVQIRFSKNPLQNQAHRVSLLYHETTYLKEAEERAFSRHHSTTEQAAAIARFANAGSLLIGISAASTSCFDDFLSETSAMFPTRSLPRKGVTYLV